MTATAEPTTEQAGLLRAVLEEPADDAPRLVYADWLDDHATQDQPCPQCGGDGSIAALTGRIGCMACSTSHDRRGTGVQGGNSFAEQAEFIRVQCKLAKWPDHDKCPECGRKRRFGWQNNGVEQNDCSAGHEWIANHASLKRRERELFSFQNLKTWGGHSWERNCLTYKPEFHNLPPDITGGLWSRGFIAAVSLPLAVLCGGECEGCDGVGDDAGRMEQYTVCPTCSGTGRTPGIARDLFRLHPITAVRLTDAVLLEVNGGVCWVNDNELDGCIPDVIFRWLRSSWQQTHIAQKPYFSDEEAHAYLSLAVVAWARGLASLPPLNEKAPGC